MENKLLSATKVAKINRLIPLAWAKVKAEVKVACLSEDRIAERYHFHMDQMTIHEGLRQGFLKGEYINGVDI